MKLGPEVSSKIFLHLFSPDPKWGEKWELAELEIFKLIQQSSGVLELISLFKLDKEEWGI